MIIQAEASSRQRSSQLVSELRWLDVLSTRTFFAHAFCERHFLTFVKVIKTDTLHDRRMKK